MDTKERQYKAYDQLEDCPNKKSSQVWVRQMQLMPGREVPYINIKK